MDFHEKVHKYFQYQNLCEIRLARVALIQADARTDGQMGTQRTDTQTDLWLDMATVTGPFCDNSNAPNNFPCIKNLVKLGKKPDTLLIEVQAFLA